jgi:hypothetical protein
MDTLTGDRGLLITVAIAPDGTLPLAENQHAAATAARRPR